jgi:hypothetical protein
MSTFTRRQTRAAKSALSWRSSLIDGVPRLAMAAGPAKDASAENATPPCGNRFSRYPLPRVGLGSDRLAKRCRGCRRATLPVPGLGRARSAKPAAKRNGMRTVSAVPIARSNNYVKTKLAGWFGAGRRRAISTDRYIGRPFASNRAVMAMILSTVSPSVASGTRQFSTLRWCGSRFHKVGPRRQVGRPVPTIKR